jgi:hypothetical protein
MPTTRITATTDRTISGTVDGRRLRAGSGAKLGG